MVNKCEWWVHPKSLNSKWHQEMLHRLNRSPRQDGMKLDKSLDISRRDRLMSICRCSKLFRRRHVTLEKWSSWVSITSKSNRQEDPFELCSNSKAYSNFHVAGSSCICKAQLINERKIIIYAKRNPIPFAWQPVGLTSRLSLFATGKKCFNQAWYLPAYTYFIRTMVKRPHIVKLHPVLSAHSNSPVS